MKNKSIITALALIIGTFTFTSCDKENLTPSPVGSDTEVVQNFDDKNTTKGFTQTKNTGTTSVTPENFVITISYAPCAGGGQSLTVSSDDVDLNNGNYTVVWFKNSETEIYAQGVTLNCVCNMGARVEIYDADGDLSASSSVDVGC